ncbi:hypothetical protein [Microbacterium sp. JZ31]|uniref:hypothetical protein n=1 Tax=Microbacterium sp. JZ31 TaxID=1906274 RepID=UPI001EE486F6|nr:hypothetical protein [Microbacterium sp. JZ31]
MREIIDAVDGAGREFKRGFAGTFRARGGKHRADADAIRGWDRRNADHDPRHRADAPASHRKDYDIREDAARGWETRGHVPKHRDPDYDLARDLGRSVGKEIHAVPGDVLDEVKGVPKKVPSQVMEELYEDAIGQSSPDEYGETAAGDMRFLAPAGEAGDLRALSTIQLEARLGLAPGSLTGAEITVKSLPGSRFASIEIDRPRD